MPWDEITGCARKPSWLLILSARELLAIRLRADWAASALALCPCVGAAASAPCGIDARVAPTNAATARPPRCLLRILSPGCSGPKPCETTCVGGEVVNGGQSDVGRPRVRPGVRREPPANTGPPGEGGQRELNCRFVHCKKMSIGRENHRHPRGVRDERSRHGDGGGRRRVVAREQLKSYGRVRISAPSAVTSSVCSNCALRRPSAVTTVQSSSHITQACVPRLSIGSIVNVIPGRISSANLGSS